MHLHEHYGCELQVGGSDQWGNITAGIDLIRKARGVQSTAHLPLVTSADGKKFGKSTGGGSLWLDPEKTSPYALYQYFVNTDDADVMRYLRWFTFLAQDELAELEVATTERPQAREAQRRLAAEMTTLVHGQANTDAVEHASQALFGRAELTELDESTLASALQEASVVEVPAGERRRSSTSWSRAACATAKGAARRAVKEGGAYVNNQRIAADDWAPESTDMLHGRWLVIRRGRKNFAGIEGGPRLTCPASPGSMSPERDGVRPVPFVYLGVLERRDQLHRADLAIWRSCSGSRNFFQVRATRTPTRTERRGDTRLDVERLVIPEVHRSCTVVLPFGWLLISVLGFAPVRLGGIGWNSCPGAADVVSFVVMVCACSLRTQQCVDECQCQIFWYSASIFRWCGYLLARFILPSEMVSV